MPEWKIILTDGLEEEGQSILRAQAQVENREGIAGEELLPILGEYDALIVRGRTKVTRQMLESAPRLKVIGRSGVGVDNIDLAAAEQCGVIVVNAPISTSVAVAELALGMLLALTRRLPYADRTMKNGEWAKKSLQGIELNGKTLGVIGMGNIGSAVAMRAAAFGMLVVGYDPLLDSAEIIRRGAKPVTLPALYERADFISIHIPLTAGTRGLVDASALKKMKPGVQLVCTARGGIIDEPALLTALESGQVAGAALDVFAQEPPGLIGLVAHPRVIATPHIGAQTAEAQARAAVDIAHEVLRALRDEPLRWRVA
jgi:D-3-phosphoglycerate dehydrogenase / 2-oxoglutarate reductase